MNCLDTLRRLHVEPLTKQPDALAHLAHCAACRRAARQLRRIEHEIESAALTMRVPEGLVARVLLRRSAFSRRLLGKLRALRP